MTKEHPLIWLWLGAVTLQIYRVPVDHLSTSYGGLDHPRPAFMRLITPRKANLFGVGRML